MLRWNASDDGNVGDFASVEAMQVIWATTSGADAVLHGHELDVVARFAGTQRLQAVVRCVLEDVETCGNRQYRASLDRVKMNGTYGSVTSR